MGKFDFYFFDVNNIFLQKYYFQKKIFWVEKKALGPFLAVKNNVFDRKVVFIYCQIFPKTFDDYFKSKEVKYVCLDKKGSR